jgi:hypothetical protein
MFVEGVRILIAALHLRRPVVFPSDGNNLDGVINLPGLPIKLAAGTSRPVRFFLECKVAR